ncbi:FecR family protein [uncultured Planktosalinus sp.]|uniref:FecR family protein n=1 Tax=uncultured Planktosalinus sp. TaxID=1810935 RepID=UPI0030D8B435
MNEELLHKYLNNEISEEELKTLQESETGREFLKIAEKTAHFNTPGFDKEKLWENLSNKTVSKPKVISLFKYKSLLKYAAMLALILTGYFYVTSLDASVTSGLAEKRTTTLPDNSEVVLNAESKIVYNKKSWNKKRTLSLQGEAYFKVAKGKKFDVETNLGTVSVLGTQFNVQSRDNRFMITCYEGLVEVTFNNQSLQLPAGNKVIIENGEITAQNQISINNPSWILDESTFDNTEFKLVINELKRQYAIQVNLESVNNSQRFTGAFTHTNLEDALKTITQPLQLTYTIGENNLVTIYGEQ